MTDTHANELDQYLTFTLDGEAFALNIASVREVLEFTTITRVPGAPEYMRGVINLRGQAVPVADLRLKFGLSRTEQTVDTCIVITEMHVSGEHLVIGILADSVREVLELGRGQVEPPPRFGTRLNTEFIRGMGRVEGGFIIILDANRIFALEDISAMGGMDAAGAASKSMADAAGAAA